MSIGLVDTEQMVYNIEKYLIIYMQHKSCACYRFGGCVNVQLYVGDSGSCTENLQGGPNYKVTVKCS